MFDTTRRGFLKWFAGATAAAVSLATADVSAIATGEVDVEKLLWVPGQKTIVDLGARPIILAEAVRPATDAEVADITGQRLLRIVHRPWTHSIQTNAAPYEPKRRHGDELITVMSEKEFARVGHVAFENSTVTAVHFDNGTIARLPVFRGADGLPSLERLRANANGLWTEHQARNREREEHKKRLRQLYGG